VGLYVIKILKFDKYPKFSAEPEEGKVYRVQQGKKITQVLGVKRSDQFGMVALCRYQEGDYELVPTSVSLKCTPFFPNLYFCRFRSFRKQVRGS
jgi:hypothetical protein